MTAFQSLLFVFLFFVSSTTLSSLSSWWSDNSRAANSPLPVASLFRILGLWIWSLSGLDPVFGLGEDADTAAVDDSDTGSDFGFEVDTFDFDAEGFEVDADGFAVDVDAADFEVGAFFDADGFGVDVFGFDGAD
jgi:hypothetical protein